MQVILSGIECLKQHIKQLNENLGSYRPSRCPSCGKAGLWYHVCYLRFPGRSLNDHHLNPISIPRFICPKCGKTCSVLPECIAARRWYLWAVQQIVLTPIYITVIFAGDGRLTAKLRCDELLPLGSRIPTRLNMEYASRDELLACLKQLQSTAGNTSLMIPELMKTLCDHALGNYRVLTGMAGELLAQAAQ